MMDLDELKTAWTSIDERLKENEMISKRMVQEMLNGKSNKSLNKLINIEVFNIITLLLAIPLCIWMLTFSHLKIFFFPKVLFVVVIAVSIFAIIYGSYALKKYLLKIDFFKSVKENMYYVNNFIIYYKRSKMINYIVVIPVFSLLGVLSYYELKVPFYLWIFLFVMLIIAIAGTYWTYKRIYDKNILSIQKSLEELSELEEE